MTEPFGKRNRRAVAEPLSTRKPALKKPAQSKGPNTKLYLYGAGAVLFVVLAAYAFA
jgi:hypothetical protein